jgi:hypothetical protein
MAISVIGLGSLVGIAVKVVESCDGLPERTLRQVNDQYQ